MQRHYVLPCRQLDDDRMLAWERVSDCGHVGSRSVLPGKLLCFGGSERRFWIVRGRQFLSWRLHVGVWGWQLQRGQLVPGRLFDFQRDSVCHWLFLPSIRRDSNRLSRGSVLPKFDTFSSSSMCSWLFLQFDAAFCTNKLLVWFHVPELKYDCAGPVLRGKLLCRHWTEKCFGTLFGRIFLSKRFLVGLANYMQRFNFLPWW